jgi:hypothetical protein
MDLIAEGSHPELPLRELTEVSRCRKTVMCHSQTLIDCATS